MNRSWTDSTRRSSSVAPQPRLERKGTQTSSLKIGTLSEYREPEEHRRLMMQKYLNSVAGPLEWYITRGEPVPRNQFGEFPRFSAQKPSD